MGFSIKGTKVDMLRYTVTLSQKILESNNKRRQLESEAILLFKKAHPEFNGSEFSDWLDWSSGAVYITDEKIIACTQNGGANLLLKLYDISPQSVFAGKKRWFLNRDDDLILRGADNYYLGLCWLPKDKATQNIPRQVFLHPLDFFRKAALLIESEGLEYKNWFHFLSMYALADNLFNFGVNLLYLLTQNTVKSEAGIILFKSSNCNSLAVGIFEWLTALAGNWYDLIFQGGEISLKAVHSSLDVLVRGYAPIIIRLVNMGVLDGRIYRSWRETDNFVENLVVLENVLQELSSEREFADVVLLGCNYGSIHLIPIAAAIASRKFGYSVINGVIMTGKSYKDLYTSKSETCSFERKESKQHGQLNIIIDDNIVSGRSLDVACSIADDNGIVVDLAVVCRYPGINRVLQMFRSRNNSCTDLDHWGTDLRGMLYPTHFTKIMQNAADEYFVDRYGVFDRVKESIFALLEKNGLYEKESLIAQWKECRYIAHLDK